MENFDIIKILGIGLSGFGFLLMYLAYKLIDRIVDMPKPNNLTIKTINRYMTTCFIMTLAVGTFTFITGYYKNEIINEQALNLDKQSKEIGLLSDLHLNSKFLPELISVVGSESSLNDKKQQLSQLTKQQNELLRKISNDVAILNDDNISFRVNKFRDSIGILADSLLITLDSSSQFMDIAKYAKLNDSLGKLILMATDMNQIHNTKLK